MGSTASPKVTPLKLETYLGVVKNSVGTHMFRNFYALIKGKPQDIMRQGDLSCAFFVSFVLVGFSLIKSIHGTVDGTKKDLVSSGWKRTRKPRPGCIIIWEPKINKRGESHKHIGFYIGNRKAVSNDSIKRAPNIHVYNIRKVDELYWHTKLNSSGR